MSDPQRVNAEHQIDFAAAVYAGTGMPAQNARWLRRSIL